MVEWDTDKMTSNGYLHEMTADSPSVMSVDYNPAGVVVTFSNGVSAVFSAELLFAILSQTRQSEEKRPDDHE